MVRYRSEGVKNMLKLVILIQISLVCNVRAGPTWIDQWKTFNEAAGNEGGEFDSWMDTPGMEDKSVQQKGDENIYDWVSSNNLMASDPEYEPMDSNLMDSNFMDWYSTGSPTTENEEATNPYYYAGADGTDMAYKALQGLDNFMDNPQSTITSDDQSIDDFMNNESAYKNLGISQDPIGYNPQQQNAQQIPNNYAQQANQNQQLQYAGNQQNAHGQQLQRDGQPLQTVGQQLQTNGQPLQTVGKQLQTDGQQLQSGGQQQFVNNQQQTAGSQQLFTNNAAIANNANLQQNAQFPNVYESGLTGNTAYDYLYNYYGSQLGAQAGNLEDGMSAVAPVHWLGQNAWMSQTIGQNYQQQLIDAYNNNVTTHGTKLVRPEQVIPNKIPSAGIPNKVPEVNVLHDGLGFLLDESPLELPQEECLTEEDEVGQCMSANRCGLQNGYPNGLCHQGMDISAHIRVCCVFPSYCGFETNKEVVYFKSPDYPEVSNSSGECHFRVRLLNEVCQIRVDFLEFESKEKSSGVCDEKHQMSISSPFKRAYMPVNTFCGSIQKEEKVARTDLRHVYINFDDIPLDSEYVEAVHHKDPFIDFKMISLEHPTRWNLRISQILCDGAPLHAPSGCTQYYNSHNGTINNLDIAQLSAEGKISSCIRTDTTACAIKYTIKKMQVGDKKKMGYGLTCQNYLSINGMKSGICGFTEDKEIILPVDGPQALNYVYEKISETADTYTVHYSYLHNCNNIEFFKYPVAK